MSEEGEKVTMSTDFSSLPLSAGMLDNLKSIGYDQMTPIQAKSLPLLLEGKDIIARAQTGSGKTAAFGVHLMEALKPKLFRIQSLVLCPTRELATQVGKELRRLARHIGNVKVLILCGGHPFGPQVGSLEHGAHIVVGTPGRLLKHLRKETLSLSVVDTLVLDEADRMLDMGFGEDVEQIIQYCTRPNRQTILFSATYPEDIRLLSASYQKEAVEIAVRSSQTHQDIEQIVLRAESREQKMALTSRVLLHYQPESTLIFCNMKVRVDELVTYLRTQGFSALALHGDLEQNERDEVLVRFANRSSSILVATDVAARGLDIHELQLVVMFDVTRDPEVHVHRVGRTGRAGHQGRAITLIAPEDEYALESLEAYLGCSIPEHASDTLDIEGCSPMLPEMQTLCIDGGRKRKVRPGDILGALTKDAGLPGQTIGKIDIADYRSYIAIHQSVASKAFHHIRKGKIKGRSFRVRRVS